MPRPKRVIPIEGDNLNRFVGVVKEEFLARDRFDEVASGPRRINTIETVAVGVYGSLSPEAASAILEDLMRENEDFVIEREPEEIFTSNNAQGVLGELVCEVARQFLRQDEAIRDLDDERDRRTDF